MIRQQVESSSVRSLGYDPANRALEVQFASGAVYRYLDVPARVVEGLAAASSIGGYVARNVRNVYRYRRLG
ncbi:KTSC domain-containing protein [Pseudonocardia humida]|uniref:KTSC domain-containing protein n=1 Tax=Pseudonocardia humida TaxID=2800819 RepID=A0ABT0ZTS1_9PSEU|nr:KTSC domain-containing protein [Pseudonocardia humida]MCO1654109.1 KTSC domain-containing protein [Pseudonocardia humida]